MHRDLQAMNKANRGYENATRDLDEDAELRLLDWLVPTLNSRREELRAKVLPEALTGMGDAPGR